MFIRVWAENIHFEKHMSGHADDMIHAGKIAESLLAAGYRRVWIEIQEES